MSKKVKFCIFCGNSPEEKTKEHVLPRWLIEMTGDPKRVVQLGYSHSSGDVFHFSWSRFTFPACKVCNENYSVFEAEAKRIVSKLLEFSALSCNEYLHLLDWLDKVRIGLWLGHRYLQDIVLSSNPNFHINTRIGTKDRQLAIYPLSQPKGINTTGSETLSFQRQPSCFSLRVNDILMLNLSWDYMCSERCGFPFPTNSYIDLDNGGKLVCSDFQASGKFRFPLFDQKIFKPSVHIFQPIMQPMIADQGNFEGTIEEEFPEIMTIEGSKRQGNIYRQRNDTVEVITNLEELIEFDEITGDDCTVVKDIIAQTYDLQTYSTSFYDYKTKDKKSLDRVRQLDKLENMQNIKIAKAYREM